MSSLLNKIFDLPEKILDDGENALDNLISLPNNILKALTAMQVPIMIIGGVILIKELTN
jgi:hypothetical protein